MAIYGFNQVHGHEKDAVTESELQVTEDPTEQETSNLTSTTTRTGRLLKYHQRRPAFMVHRRRPPIQIRSRADHFPIRPQLRRVHNGVLSQPPLRYGYDTLKSSSKYIASKGIAGQYGKGSSLKQQLLAIHPNGVQVPALSQQYVQNFKASPAFNGKVVIHSGTANQATLQQQQQPSQSQENSYPQYIKPPTQQQQSQQLGQATQSLLPQQQSELQQYPEFQQYPIPDQQKMQKFNEQHDRYLQQQQQYLTPRDPIAYYQQQQYQHQQAPQQLPQLQQPVSTYTVQTPAFIASVPATASATAQKPVLQAYHHHSGQPSIPIHEVAESALANSSPNLAAAGGNASPFGHAAPAPPTVPAKMYSVYEENDMTELQNNDYQTAQFESLEREAQEYLRFMNTNEYFLPKRDPNYKKIDEENDRRQQYNLQQQQHQQLQLQQQQQQQHQQPYHQRVQNSPEALQHQHQIHYGQQKVESSAAASTTSQHYQDPIQVSKLFYQDEKNGHQQGSGPSTVVRTSYQTGYNANQIVVSSQDNKVSKYLGSSQKSITVPTQSPVSVNNVYSQVRQSPQNSRTPEPLRFEFTERDALVGGFAFTNAPKPHLKYKAVDTPITPKLPEVVNPAPTTARSVLATTLRSSTYQSGIKPVVEIEDDPEDGDDMQHAGTHLYGRQPLQNKQKISSTTGANATSSTTEAPPNEQKDTEDYCERICAIVEDEHEEIVCGSDGYMYTSEAQMECYASCLHIDITIQGKGSCTAR
uniref:Kazal-like domain-containing protein n=1 Tax=Stomoxys calcitrans TaxID=35570 RepID=A0A1I8P304_STOCA